VKNNIKIKDVTIGSNSPPYIIAELSGNHNGDINRAIRLIDAASDAGASAIKLQTYTADTITINSSRPEFMIKSGLWAGRNLYELYSEASTPWNWHETLFNYAEKKNIHCFSSPFDESAVDFLDQLSSPAFKIASFELVDLPLIQKAASKGKPLIMSTGVADFEEITDACITAKHSGADGYALLHCISEYPAQPKDMRLATIKELEAKFKVPIGLSDHTLGSTMAIASIALGATIIEKHITLNRSDGGPDADFSLEPEEFKRLVEDCSSAYEGLSQGYDNRPGIKKSNAIFRRSLFVTKDIKAGELLNETNVRSIRPGMGIPPKYLNDIIGKSAKINLSKGEPLSWEKIEM